MTLGNMRANVAPALTAELANRMQQAALILQLIDLSQCGNNSLD